MRASLSDLKYKIIFKDVVYVEFFEHDLIIKARKGKKIIKIIKRFNLIFVVPSRQFTYSLAKLEVSNPVYTT
jgi:hypothetical protein